MAGTETGFEGVWRLKTGVGRRKYCFLEGRGIDGLNVVEGEKSRKGSSVCEDSEGGEKIWRFLRWGGGVSLNFALLGCTAVFLSVISTELSNAGGTDCCCRGRGLFCGCCWRWGVSFGLERESNPGVCVGRTMSVGGADGCLRWFTVRLCW